MLHKKQRTSHISTDFWIIVFVTMVWACVLSLQGACKVLAKELNAEKTKKELVALIEEKGNITVFGEFNQRLRIDNGILVEEWREGTKLHVTTYFPLKDILVDKIATGSYLRYLTPDELRQGYSPTLCYKIELCARSWKPPEKRFIRRELSDGKVRYCDSWSINASSEQSAQEIAKALKHLIILYGGN